MIRPSYLKSGDHVGIVAPAGIVKETDVNTALRILQEWELKTMKGKHLFEKNGFFAGTDQQRYEDFQTMLDNPDMKAIFCVRGGYGIIRIIEKLDFTRFLIFPKWIIGYSDITIFHIYLNNRLKCESLHAIMPKNFEKAHEDRLSLPSLKNALFGESMVYTVEKHKLNRPGKSDGILVGGNLSVIYSLQGTHFEINTENKILFIEDLDESVYHIDRMMMNLKLSGKLENLKGLIVGGMTKIKPTTPDYGKTVYEVISDNISDGNYPVVFGFQAGHMHPNHSLYMGRNVVIDVTDQNSMIRFKV